MVGLINPYNGGLQGQSGYGLNLPAYDWSGLSLYYASGVALGTNLHAEVLKNGPLAEFFKPSKNQDVIPPWLQATPAEDTSLVDKVFSGDKLLNLDDPSIARAGVDDTTKQLFALYKALDRVRALTEYAQTSAGQAQAIVLKRRFDDWTKQIRAFVDEHKFEGMTFVPGLITDKVESTVARKAADPVDLALGLPIDDVFIGAQVTDTRFAAIPTIAGDETFTMSVTENGSTTNLAVDLSAAASTEIDDIANYLTSLLSGAGFATEVKVQRNHETSYALQVVGSTGETLSFSSPSDDEGAVYIAGKTSAGSFANGVLVKLDDLDSGDPNQTFYKNIFTDKADSAERVAVDSDGYVYVVGTTKGVLDDQIANGTQDVFLTKYDHSGRAVFTRMLGSAKDTGAFAIAIDDDDNVFVAGQTYGPLTATANSTNTGISDSFVTKFDSAGQEEWTRQTAPYSADGALALATDASGNVYVTGYVSGQLDSSQTNQGGVDAYLTKLDADGTLVYNQQFGTADSDTATAVAVDAGGIVYVAGMKGANGYVARYDDSGGSPALDWESDLGDLGTDGAIGALALDSSGDVYVAGTTTNAGLDNQVREAHSGGTDGFVLKVNDANGNFQWVTYTGTAGDDSVKGIAIDPNTDDIYVTGETDSGFAGETDSPGPIDAFVTRFDSNGGLDFVHQFGGSASHRGLGIAFDGNGTNVLSRLGLPEGDLFAAEARTVVSQTTARADQSFVLEIDGTTSKRITIGIDDTFGYLASRINSALGTAGKAQVRQEGDVERLVITALNGHEIVVRSGPAGFDALAGLGLRAARIIAKLPDTGDEAQLAAAKASRFELGFTNDMRIDGKKAAADAQIIFDNALREVRDAYRFSVVGYEEPKPVVGPAPPAIAVKIAAYQDALARLQGGFGSGGYSF